MLTEVVVLINAVVELLTQLSNLRVVMLFYNIIRTDLFLAKTDHLKVVIGVQPTTIYLEKVESCTLML